MHDDENKLNDKEENKDKKSNDTNKNDTSENKKDRFEIQITVVAQGGIKFFFLKILKISKYFKNLKTKKNQINAKRPLLEDHWKLLSFWNSKRVL